MHILLNLRKCFEWTDGLIPRNVNSDSVVMKYAAYYYSGLCNVYLLLVQWSQLYLVGDGKFQVNTRNIRRVNKFAGYDSERPWLNLICLNKYLKRFSCIKNGSLLTHWGRVTQICVFTLQLCKTDDANLRF